MKQLQTIILFGWLVGISTGQEFVDVNNPNLAEEDERRYRFCGNSFWDAIDKCGTWCPNDDDNECPDGEECFGDTYCKYTTDLEAGSSLTTSTATEIAAGTIAEIAVDSSVTNTTITNNPTQQPSLSVSLAGELTTPQPSVGVAAKINEEDALPTADDEDEDWSQSTEDEDWSQEEEDWSQVPKPKNLWCGTSQFDAIRNCGTGTRCDNGICQGGLKCFAVPGSCGGSSDVNTGESENGTTETPLDDENLSEIIVGGTLSPSLTTAADTTTETPGIPTYSPSSSTYYPTSKTWAPTTGRIIDLNGDGSTTAASASPTFANAPTGNISPSFPLPELSEGTDPTDTLFCGYTLDDAETACHKRCRSGSPGECPAGETCFRGVSCTNESPRSPPTKKPTSPPTPDPTIHIEYNNRCAADYGELVETCWSAVTCNNTHHCPGNQTCFENVDCAVTSYSMSDIPTSSPPPSSFGTRTNSLGSKQNYCAENETDLVTSCGLAPTCNDGDPPCPLGTLCFGDHVCAIEGQSLAPSSNKIKTPSYSPSSSPIYQPPQPSLDDQQLLCASSMAELETSCESAISCNDGPCPAGKYCFPFTCKITSVVKEPASFGEKTYFCARNELELKENCGMLTQCNNGLPSCTSDTKCFEYDCQQSIDLCPLNYVGWQSSHDCLEFYECENGIAGPSNFCENGLKFDKMRGKCTDGILNEYCYGPPVPPPTPKPTPPPLPNFCPTNVDGWHASSDCREYYKCQDGDSGAIQVCEDGLKFDKVRSKCVAESSVNNFCYGPPLDDAELPNGEGKIDFPTRKPSEPPKIDNGPCPEGLTGWEASSDCSQYYWCDEGVQGNRYDCGDGLLFDSEDEICTFADEVECKSRVVTLTTRPTQKVSAPVPLPIGTTRSPIQPSRQGGTSLPTVSSGQVWSDTASPTVFINAPADPPWLGLTRKDENSATSIIGVPVQLQFLCLILFMQL